MADHAGVAAGITPQRDDRPAYPSCRKIRRPARHQRQKRHYGHGVSLRRPREYSMAEGARFEVHLTKARGILGDDAKPFEANLITEGNALHWRVRDIEDVELEELKRLLGEGYSIRDCAEEMGKSKSSVHRLKRKLEGLA